MNTSRSRPLWIDEETLLQNILQRFIDQIERSVKAQFRISPKSTPELYDFINNDTRYLWQLVKSLDKEYHLITIKKQNTRSHQESYEGALLIFNTDKEAMLRGWLNRPALDPYTLIWNDSLDKVRHRFEDHGVALNQCIRIPQKSASEVIKAFASLHDEIQTPQTLRNLSSRCFWGDSKFLDKQLELLTDLFPEASKHIIPRAVLVDVVLPKTLGEVLFIENLDTFLMLKSLSDRDMRFMKTAFVYSAGFKSSASYIRQRDRAIFSVVGQNDRSAVDEFKRWWLQEVKNDNISCYFWGDFDYSGMAILLSLRQVFPNITAWEIAYTKMLQYFQRGVGHSYQGGKKAQQKDPIMTGCTYSDETLLPLMRKEQRFLDQEVINEIDFLRSFSSDT